MGIDNGYLMGIISAQRLYLVLQLYRQKFVPILPLTTNFEWPEVCMLCVFQNVLEMLMLTDYSERTLKNLLGSVATPHNEALHELINEF